MKLPKPKKVNKSSQKKKADKLFSELVRSVGYCQAEGKAKECKCGGGLQCAHLITRWNLRLRWDEKNALALCAGHHRFFTHRPLEWAEFLLRYFPERYEYVMKHKNELSTETFAEVINRLI